MKGNEEPEWPIPNIDLAGQLGLSEGRIRQLKKELISNRQLNFSEDYIESYIPGHSHEVNLWTRSGAIKAAKLVRTREASDFLMMLGEPGKQTIKKEHHYRAIIIEAINGFTRYRKQYCHKYFLESNLYQPYIIDIYLPDLKIAIECDENAHDKYDESREKERQLRLEQELGCRFIRFNPDDEDFNIGKIINEISK